MTKIELGKVFLSLSIVLLVGCASEKPLSSYDDSGLCTLKGQALGYGNTQIMPKIQAEFARRGALSISKEDCDLYIRTGEQNAKVSTGTTKDIIEQSQRSQTINAIRGY